MQPHVQPGILPTVFVEDIEPMRMCVLDAVFLTHLHKIALWPIRSLLRMHLLQYSNYRLQHTLTNPLASV
ncbi:MULTISPECIES: hypothetical protein [unclassified Pseudomonas]|uniref:hypothetical protein n=1 Tax=unclassified Pseudomonas TaxID=196821 RepID=UPI0021156FC8|nr:MULTISPECIES: hypothetical protein [unclassified Pseudomonas]